LLSGVIRGLNRCPRSDTLLLMAVTGYKPHSTLLPAMSQKSFIELSSEDPSFTGLIPRVREYVGLKGLDWCITAMVHGSIGYHSYDTAKHLIESVMDGRNWVCERTIACFRANAAKEASATLNILNGLQ